MKKLISLLALLLLLGCQGGNIADEPLPRLTKAQWAKMDESCKYQTETLKRLKDSVP